MRNEENLTEPNMTEHLLTTGASDDTDISKYLPSVSNSNDKLLNKLKTSRRIIYAVVAIASLVIFTIYTGFFIKYCHYRYQDDKDKYD